VGVGREGDRGGQRQECDGPRTIFDSLHVVMQRDRPGEPRHLGAGIGSFICPTLVARPGSVSDCGPAAGTVAAEDLHAVVSCAAETGDDFHRDPAGRRARCFPVQSASRSQGRVRPAGYTRRTWLSPAHPAFIVSAFASLPCLMRASTSSPLPSRSISSCLTVEMK